eukprot:g9028.t1
MAEFLTGEKQRQALESERKGGKIFVGNIRKDVEKAEIEDAFVKYGEVLSVWIAKNPPGFCFVTYRDPEDANDAVSQANGLECGLAVAAGGEEAAAAAVIAEGTEMIAATAAVTAGAGTVAAAAAAGAAEPLTALSDHDMLANIFYVQTSFKFIYEQEQDHHADEFYAVFYVRGDHF